MMGRVVVTGGTGQVGRPLVRALAAAGCEVVVLTRRPEQARGLVPEAADWVAFDPELPETWEHTIDGADGVVVLGGAPFFRRWSSWDEFERVATGGRVAANRAIVDAIARAEHKPRVLVTGSSVGYYGFEVSEAIVTEDTPAGTDRWAQGTGRYETEAKRAAQFGIRVVCLRTGIVFSPDDGMAAQMADQFRRGFGAVILPGTQWLPWIHIDDEVALIMLALNDDRVTGGLNASSPNPARYREYAAALGHVFGRRVRLRLPGLVMRLALKDIAEAVLYNRRMVPAKALGLGFEFTHPDLEPALHDLLTARGGR